MKYFFFFTTFTTSCLLSCYGNRFVRERLRYPRCLCDHVQTFLALQSNEERESWTALSHCLNQALSGTSSSSKLIETLNMLLVVNECIPGSISIIWASEQAIVVLMLSLQQRSWRRLTIAQVQLHTVAAEASRPLYWHPTPHLLCQAGCKSAPIIGQPYISSHSHWLPPCSHPLCLATHHLVCVQPHNLLHWLQNATLPYNTWASMTLQMQTVVTVWCTKCKSCYFMMNQMHGDLT